ncbi:MAG: ABC transporter permease [Planctomycetes bacterium]|nr:ABC transporter permease [Planctomycetota bacterium]
MHAAHLPTPPSPEPPAHHRGPPGGAEAEPVGRVSGGSRTLTERWRPLWQLLLTRLREFYREPSVIFWVYGFPLFLAIGLGVAFSGGLPDAPGVTLQQSPAVDIQQTPYPEEAADLQRQLQAAGMPASLQSAAAGRHNLRIGRSALFIVPSPQGYQYMFDPTRAECLLARNRVDDLVQRWKTGPAAWPVKDTLIREPGNRYIDFLIPGLMGLNIMGGALWGVGYVVVDMRVRKLLKRLLATPMRRTDFLVSLLGSRVVFLVPEMLVLVLVGYLGFGVPVRGHLGTLVLVILAGSASFSGLGLLLACRTEKTETVSGLINLFVLPMWMLCGTFFSSQCFPEAVQPVIRALPLTQLNQALRGVMLEGASLQQVAWAVVILAVWGGASFLVALQGFRWK